MGFKRNVILVTAAAATVLLGTVLGAAETPRYPVYPLERAPDLDGTVDGDPAWAGLPQGVGFHVLGGRSAAPDETSFRMAFTDKALYVAFVCKEPDVTNVAAISKDGGSAIWREDGVEAFILPRGAAEIFQVVVNAAGARINYRLDAGDPEMVGAAPLAASRAAAFKGDDFYSIEIEIPFEALGRTPGDGDVWTGNLCRNVNLGPDHTNENFSWAHTISRYCEPGRFAQFVFHRERPATGEKDVDALASGGDDAELHLVVSLSFDEGHGDVAHGQSAIINDGKIVGADWTRGRFGRALDFRDTGDRVEVPHSESLKGITSALTLECWADFDLDKLSGTSGTLIAKAPASGFGYGYYLLYSDKGSASRRLTLGIAQDWKTRIWLQVDDAITTAGWHHVIATYDPALTDGARGKMYLDGTLAGTFDEKISGINPNDLPLTVGSRLQSSAQPELGMGYTFKGIIDEVKVWDVALGPDEIERLYGFLWAKSEPLAPAPSELVKNGKPRFEWTPAQDGTGYVFEMGSVPDFSRGVLKKETLAAAQLAVAQALSPGVYYWRVWSTDKKGAPTAAAAPRAFIVPWPSAFTPADTTPPVITDVQPARDTTPGTPRPEISALWRDDGEIDPATARMLLDGEDVTPKATVTAQGISFAPGADLAKGVHKIDISVCDAAGNPSNRVRQEFAVGEPCEILVEVRADNRTVINGEPFFPIMSYHGGVSLLERVRIGFNSGYGGSSVPGTEEEFATYLKRNQRARAAGFKDMGSFSGYYHRGEEEKVAAAVPFLSRDTTFLAFNLDEPNGSPKGIGWARHLYKNVLASGHRRPVVHILNNPGASSLFGEVADIIHPDCYPVPNRPLVQVSKFIDHAHEQLGRTKPVWFCQQAFDWRVRAMPIPEGKTYRDLAKSLQDSGWVFRPTPAETRCMTYLALAHDVQGILWWGGVANSVGNVVNWPDPFRDFCALVGEVRHLSPMLLAPDAPVAIEVTPAGLPLHFKAKSYAKKIYVIAVNPNEDLPVAPTFTLPAGSYTKVDVLFENRAMKLAGASFRDLFEPAGVHVYRIE